MSAVFGLPLFLSYLIRLYNDVICLDCSIDVKNRIIDYKSIGINIL